MALFERRDRDDWAEKGRFYYRTAYQGRQITYQIKPALQREFEQRGYGEGYSFKDYEIAQYVRAGLFFTLGEDDAGHGVQSAGVNDAVLAEDPPRSFHARVKMLSDVDPVTNVATSRMLEWPPCVRLEDAFARENGELSKDTDSILVPAQLRLWIAPSDEPPTDTEFVRILESSHSESDASFISERRMPESGEHLQLPDGRTVVVDEFEEGQFIKARVLGGGSWVTLAWEDIVASDCHLKSSFVDGDYWGQRLTWKIARRGTKVRHYRQVPPTGLQGGIHTYFQTFHRADPSERPSDTPLVVSSISSRSIAAFRWFLAAHSGPVLALSQQGFVEFVTTAIEIQYPEGDSVSPSIAHSVFEAVPKAFSEPQQFHEELLHETDVVLDAIWPSDEKPRLVVGVHEGEFPSFRGQLLRLAETFQLRQNPVEIYEIVNTDAVEDEEKSPFDGFRAEKITNPSQLLG